MLLDAAQNGRTKDVIILTGDLQIDVNHADEYGSTALRLAAGNGHTKTVQPLIAAGADVNHADDDSWTALMYAARNGYAKTVKVLLFHIIDSTQLDRALQKPCNEVIRQAIQVIIVEIRENKARGGEGLAKKQRTD